VKKRGGRELGDFICDAKGTRRGHVAYDLRHEIGRWRWLWSRVMAVDARDENEMNV